MTMKALAFCALMTFSLQPACGEAEETHCEWTERAPLDDEVAYGKPLSQLPELISGTYSGKVTWQGGVERAFTVDPSTGVADLEVVVQVVRVYTRQGRLVGDPSARLACPSTRVADLDLTITTADRALFVSYRSTGYVRHTAVETGGYPLKLEGEGVPRVAFSHPEFWDEILSELSLVVWPDGRVTGDVAVRWQEDSDFYRKMIASLEAVRP